jgi:outer membrane protein assembly factor BamD (BamD/ComL family)
MIYQGSLAHQVEASLREARYPEALETLDQWGHDLPGDKIEGYWSWMFARAALGSAEPEAVVAEADVLVRVNPVSNYGARLLLLASQALGATGREASARKYLQRIVKEFPESPLVPEVVEKLKVADD